MYITNLSTIRSLRVVIYLVVIGLNIMPYCYGGCLELRLRYWWEMFLDTLLVEGVILVVLVWFLYE